MEWIEIWRHPVCLLAGLHDPSLFCIKPFLSLRFSPSSARPFIPGGIQVDEKPFTMGQGTDATGAPDVRHAPVVTAAQIRADGFGRKRLPSTLLAMSVLACHQKSPIASSGEMKESAVGVAAVFVLLPCSALPANANFSFNQIRLA